MTTETLNILTYIIPPFVAGLISCALVTKKLVWKDANKYWESHWRWEANLDSVSKVEASQQKLVEERLAFRQLSKVLRDKGNSTMRKIVFNVFLAALSLEILWYVPKFLALGAKWLSLHVK